MLCLRCKKEFTANPKNKGTPQLYCSKVCSTRTHNSRRGKIRIRNRPCGSQEYREIILSFYSKKCNSCGSNKNLCIHHILPVFMGGKNEYTNIMLLCRQCHEQLHLNTTYASKPLNNKGIAP